MLFGYGASQFLRLASNLILTRLLAREFFGLMALVQVFITGLELFSDVGIGPSIVRSPRGEDRNFINTAWTIQVMRGFGLWLLSCAIAWPVAAYYDDKPELLWLLPIIGSVSAIRGLASTSIFSLQRRLMVGARVRLRLTTQCLSLLVILTWASIRPSIWALVAGNLISSIAFVYGSYRITDEPINRFTWDRSAIAELVGFGRWIFVATAMTFLAQQADRLILGKLLSASLLGVYTIAFTFADIPQQIVERLQGSVLFPAISKHADLPRSELRAKLLAPRWKVLFGLAGILALLAGCGDLLVTTLYDPRYYLGAGMLPILALGLWPRVLSSTLDPALLAIGKSFYRALGSILKFGYLLIFMPLGYRQFGVLGAIVAIAFDDLPYYIAVNYGARCEKLAGWHQDLLSTLALAAALAGVWWGRSLLGIPLPAAELWQALRDAQPL